MTIASKSSTSRSAILMTQARTVCQKREITLKQLATSLHDKHPFFSLSEIHKLLRGEKYRQELGSILSYELKLALKKSTLQFKPLDRLYLSAVRQRPRPHRRFACSSVIPQ
ncbi:MAG: hypothetical protein AAFV95_25360 [Bacteroidota bacterium]